MASVTGDYQFSAQPRTVQSRHPKYRDSQQPLQTSNIMFDKRVVRGNTYAAMIIPASAQQQLQQQQQIDRKRKQQTQQREATSTPKVDRQASTPEPVQGREHQSIQTENLIQELTDNPVEYEIQTQTDYFMDRPPTPLFMPQKIGEDQDTQVQDGQLFEFDIEVDPILEVLVTKNLEQARMEVLEQEELESMRAHQREFQQKRNAEIVEVQRLEAEELRRRNESQRRKLQARTRKDQIKNAHEKFLCRIMSKKYLSKCRNNAVQVLRHQGFYNDPVSSAFYDQFLPWLSTEILNDLSSESSVKQEVTILAKEAYEKLKKNHADSVYGEYEKRRLAKEAHDQFLAEQEIRKQKRNDARIARQRQKEIEQLKARIQVDILQKCQKKDNTNSQLFSDIDGRQTDAIVGTPGGLFAQFVHTLSALEQLTKKVLTEDQINNFIYDFSTRMKSPYMVFQNFSLASFNEFLAGWDPNINSQNVQEASEEIKIEVSNFMEDPQNAFPDTPITLMMKNPSLYKLRQDLIIQCIKAFVKFWGALTKPDGSQNLARTRLELRGLQYQGIRKEQAVVRIRIPMIKDPPYQNPEGVTIIPQAREVDKIEDRVLLLPPNTGDLSFFVIHQAAQRSIRNQLANWVKSLREFEQIDFEKLFSLITKRAASREKKILQALASHLPVLDFEVN